MTSAPQAGPEGTPALGEAAATGTGGAPAARAVPEATVARLAVYLRMLGELAEQGTDTVSSDELAAVCGVNSAKLRKDLSYVGSHGIRGVGYEVGPLLHHLESTLGLTHRQSVALVGIGNLGHALAGYGGFGGRGFPVTALFDVDPDLVGIKINGILVDHVRDIPHDLPRARRHDRHDRHARPRGAGCLRPAGPSGCLVHLELRPGRPAGTGAGGGAEGGPCRGAADPVLPRRAQAPRREGRARSRSTGTRW